MYRFYKDVLNNIPTAVIAVDKNLKVRFANRAFREYFGAEREGKELKDAVACAEPSACGKGEKCAFCTIRNLFIEAGRGEGNAFKKLILRKGEENFAITIKVHALGKYYLGVVDNAYETEIAREMYTAQNIQQRLLPPAKTASATPYSFMFIPCREIGGDLPDVYEAAGETMALLADVSGKGISAGMLSAFVKAGWDRSDLSPAHALCTLNGKFQELNLDERSYVTAAAVRVEGKKKQIRYCVAGHNVPLLLKSRQGIDEIVMHSPPVSNWIPDYVYEDRTMEYRAGDILAILTDGVTESRNAKGEMFGLERVESVLQRSESAERFISRLKAALTEFCGSFADDITAIAFDL